MKQFDENRLILYIDQSLPAAERAEVDVWLKESKENQKQLDQLYFIIAAAEKLSVMQAVDPDLSLKNLKESIKKKKQQQRYKKQIYYLQRIAAVLFIPLLFLTGYFAFRNNGNHNEWLTIKANPGVVTSVNLPDGSKVWLNANSELTYPAVFYSDKREVRLNGEALFEVTKNKEKPFIVKTNSTYEVEVLGTTFNVSAFGNDNLIETTLVEGSVKLRLQTPSGKILTTLLSPNEKAEYNKQGENIKVFSVNSEYDIAWKNGELIFRNHPMERVLKILERHYHVQFRVKDEIVMQSIITARFKDEQLPQVLEYLKMASGIQYTIHKPEIKEGKAEPYFVDISK